MSVPKMQRWAVSYEVKDKPARVFVTYDSNANEAAKTVAVFLKSQGEKHDGEFWVTEAGSFDYRACDVVGDATCVPSVFEGRTVFG